MPAKWYAPPLGRRKTIEKLQYRGHDAVAPRAEALMMMGLNSSYMSDHLAEAFILLVLAALCIVSVPLAGKYQPVLTLLYVICCVLHNAYLL